MPLLEEVPRRISRSVLGIPSLFPRRRRSEFDVISADTEEVAVRRIDDLDARWSDDGLTALLQGRDGSWLAHLRVEQWYGDQQLDPELAWVASWLDPEAETPTMLSAAIERPAMTADTSDRQRKLVEGALAAIDDPPEVPAPFEPGWD